MNARPVVAVVLLLTFPASTFAQTLDLKSIKVANEDSRSKPVSLPGFRIANPFQQNAPAPAMACAESEARGRTDADAKSMSKGWFWCSLGAGAGLGIIGLIGAPIVATTVKPKPKTVPQDVDAACYTQGYGSKRRHENALTSLWGSLAGLGAWILFYGIAYAAD